MATLIAAATAANAASFTVICPSGGPGAYPSITAALNAITNNTGPNYITVSGVCTENVLIRDQTGLVIQAAPGTAPVITNAANPAQITIQLYGSRLVYFSGLSIQGGNPGLFLNQGSDLTLANSVIENNVGHGAEALIHSDLNISSSIVRNNGGDGILIGDSSVLLVMSPIQVLNNGAAGVQAYSSGYIKLQSSGGHLIEGNAGPGISAGPDGHVLVQASQPNVIRSNGGGLYFQDGSTGEIDGPNTIDSNGPVGVLAAASVVTFRGSSGGTTIVGHGDSGAVVVRGGQMTFDGPHLVTGNGRGVRLERSMLTVQNGTSVSSNTGFGIKGDAASGLVLGPDASVGNNAAAGVRLLHRSNIGLNAPVTMSGNSGPNIWCDLSASAYGDVAGISGVRCESAD
jgi:hypothetical protein